jgi:hypothetical protein
MLLVWVECSSCVRIDKLSNEFNYPADLADGMQLFVWQPCDQCGRPAKLQMRREIELAH